LILGSLNRKVRKAYRSGSDLDAVANSQAPYKWVVACEHVTTSSGLSKLAKRAGEGHMPLAFFTAIPQLAGLDRHVV